MSIDACFALYEDLKRLMTAGIGLAQDDFRLKKHLPVLEAAATKVPVFNLLAQGVKELVETGETEAFFNLAALTAAVVNTQGESTPLEPVAPLTSLGIDLPTPLPYRLLCRFRAVLTGTGAGKTAALAELEKERGKNAIGDLRLLPLMLQATGDSYSNVAQFARNALKEMGPPIIPLLRTEIRLEEGKAREAALLRLDADLERNAGEVLYLEALNLGSPAIQLAALYALRYCPAQTPLLLEMTRAKARKTRLAARQSLIAQIFDETSPASDDFVTTLLAELVRPQLETYRETREDKGKANGLVLEIMETVDPVFVHKDHPFSVAVLNQILIATLLDATSTQLKSEELLEMTLGRIIANQVIGCYPTLTEYRGVLSENANFAPYLCLMDMETLPPEETFDRWSGLCRKFGRQFARTLVSFIGFDRPFPRLSESLRRDLLEEEKLASFEADTFYWDPTEPPRLDRTRLSPRWTPVFVDIFQRTIKKNRSSGDRDTALLLCCLADQDETVRALVHGQAIASLDTSVWRYYFRYLTLRYPPDEAAAFILDVVTSVNTTAFYAAPDFMYYACLGGSIPKLYTAYYQELAKQEPQEGKKRLYGPYFTACYEAYAALLQPKPEG